MTVLSRCGMARLDRNVYRALYGTVTTSYPAVVRQTARQLSAVYIRLTGRPGRLVSGVP
jgi:hypothetical protein